MSSSSAEDIIAQTLAQDRPTIDSALKAYASWVCARALVEDEASEVVISNTQVLGFARVLSKAINGYKFNGDEHASKFSAVVAQVWNGLLDSNQKPSRFLGRLALLHAWDGIVASIDYPPEQGEQAQLFVQEFGDLTKRYKESQKEPLEHDSDPHLLWDVSGAELERRRERRNERAEEVKRNQLSQITPIIEELKEDS